MEEKILSDFNLYQKKAHETANYPSGTIRKEAHARYTDGDFQI